MVQAILSLTVYCSLFPMLMTGLKFDFLGFGGEVSLMTAQGAQSGTPAEMSRGKLVAWCIVPFDAKNRTPEERAEMLKQLGIKEFAYDWRAEHIPTFDREVDALNKAGVHLRAFWFPGAINAEAKAILNLIERRKLDCELWVMLPEPNAKTQAEKVAQAVNSLKPIAAEAGRLGVKVGLYNHGGWMGEPENQLQVLQSIQQPHIGIVYNLHHGHDHLPRLADILASIKDKLLCLNLNGMDLQGDRVGRKILQMGQGSLDQKVLQIIKASDYHGPIGVLGHTSHDARLTLLDNLEGLEWLLAGQPDPKPTPRTPVPQVQKPVPLPAPGSVHLVPNTGENRFAALTIEWRGKFAASEQFQVLVANGPKSSPHHWEIFQRPGTGQLTVYLPGCTPDHIETDFRPEAGKTHTVSLRVSSTRGEIAVDGKGRGFANLLSRGFASGVDQLAIGGLVDGHFATQGTMSWLSIRRGWAELSGGAAEPNIDADTVGLWRAVQKSGKPQIETVTMKLGTKATLEDTASQKPATAKIELTPYDKKLVDSYLAKARQGGNPARGAVLFQSEKLACISCHLVETKGGKVGPDLTKLNACLPPDQIVESLIWPQKEVKPEFKARAVTTVKGRIIQGYVVSETKNQLTLKEATTQDNVVILKGDIEETRDIGSLMPVGLFESMSEAERVDMLAFLLSLGGAQYQSAWMAHAAHGLAVVQTPVLPGPIDPSAWPNSSAFPNRERLYEFYQKQALQVLAMNPRPGAVQAFPGLDQGLHGHWGNQNEDTWRDARWNEADLGHVMSGVCRQGFKTVAKGVAVFLDDAEGHSVVFNPETLQFDLAWKGGFVRFSDTRHGFMDGLIPKGPPVPAPTKKDWPAKTVYRGFQRVGKETAFVLESQGQIWLDCCRVNGGKIERITLPRKDHPLAESIVKNAPLWPQEIVTKMKSGSGGPYVVDTIEVPFDNAAKSPMFFGDLDFLPRDVYDVLLVCTMQGEVWRVSTKAVPFGAKALENQATWRKVASGIHQALGLKVVDGVPYVLGRDQITRLVDTDGDGEYDYHECFANCWKTSPSGHDYICGLERDDQGRFVTASSDLGVMRIAADGKSMEVLATGFRNPDGIGLNSKGQITVPCSEGEWTPTSMICQIRKGGFYGYGGPRAEKIPDLPMVYLPRGLDNSAGGQTEITSKNWGPLKGLRLHFSFGACAHFLLLDDEVDGQPQGAIVPLKGDFQSGIHRGRFSPLYGQLWVTGMQGWGSYAAKDGCLQRVRFTDGPVHQPTSVRAHANGIFVQFSEPVDPVAVKNLNKTLVMAWNYRYGPQYGSPEFLVNHPQTKGHEVWNVERVHCLSDPRQVFVEIPSIQRANQIQLHLQPWQGDARDLFLTVHNLRPDFTEFPGYQNRPKTLLPHSIAQDIRLSKKAAANPWKHPRAGARKITVQAGSNLTFAPNFLSGKAGEVIALEFANPDAVPHNWALIAPGTLAQFGDAVNRQISDPDAFARQYIPDGAQVVAYTDVVQPQDKFTIYFTLPAKPGRYPFVCSFPGHWMVMNGVFSVEP